MFLEKKTIIMLGSSHLQQFELKLPCVCNNIRPFNRLHPAASLLPVLRDWAGSHGKAEPACACVEHHFDTSKEEEEKRLQQTILLQ